ncbi:MAG: NADH-quinone oxidoreductase subunit NuoG [Candidatus Zixiibacteriota bacterium]|nr:MAG: NADH-quinone oxidoreductase subunit NuoG [candidate division Zixibacteria bacterium]
MAEAVTKKAPSNKATVTLTIDGRSVTVDKGTTVLEAARSLGIHVPTFCWHPKLKSVGSCRMCYVEIEKMPKLQVSCATEAMDGMVVATDSDLVKQGRRAVIEFILMNHPLDCPTCDQGGECQLQDLTFAHAIDDSRFAFQKERFVEDGSVSTFDDVQIGPEIMLNRNRCIQCYKCVRANKEAFGEFDLGAFERGNITEINAAPGRQVDNPFSGNLAEICPVGALTGMDWRYKIRVWLTKTVSSICPFTASGVNTLMYMDETKNRIYRTTSRRNDEIDDGWLSNVSRYAYQVVHADDRLLTPFIRRDGKQVEATWDEALDLIAKRLSDIQDQKGCVCIGGLVSPRLDNATLYGFNKLMRHVIGTNNVDYRTEYRMLPQTPEDHYQAACSQPIRISDVDDSDVIVVFGSDMLKEHPNLYLRIRKAFNFGAARIFILNPYSTKASDVAELEMVYHAGMDEVALGAVCLTAVEKGIVSSDETDRLREAIAFDSASAAALACGLEPDHLELMARAMAEARKVTFLAGEIISRSREREPIAAAICNLNRLFSINTKGQFGILPGHSNSRGAHHLGLAPDPPASIKAKLRSLWGQYPDTETNTTDSMMVQMRKEEIDGLIIMGANPVMLYPDRAFARESLEKLDFLVVSDLFETETTELADVVLPLSSWAEYTGDYVNLEGRVQTASKAIHPIGDSRPGYAIVEAIADRLENTLYTAEDYRRDEIDTMLEVDTACPVPNLYVPSKGGQDEDDAEYPIALMIGDDPHHRGHYTEKSASLTSHVGEAYLELSPDLAAGHEIKEGDSVRIESPVGKVVLPARISEHIRNDIVFVPRNFPSAPVTSLLMRKRRIDRVRISKVVR